MICEDGWNDDGRDYLVNPFTRLGRRGAGPGGVDQRQPVQHRQARAASRDLRPRRARGIGLPIVYVNQVGGHDQLVLRRRVVRRRSRTRRGVRGAALQPQTSCTLQVRNRARSSCDAMARRWAPSTPQGLSTIEFYRRQIVLGLRDYARRCGFRKAVVGSSGGIDSALTLALAVEALGAENVVAITMPSQFSSSGQRHGFAAAVPEPGHRAATRIPSRELVELYARQFGATFGDAAGRACRWRICRRASAAPS